MLFNGQVGPQIAQDSTQPAVRLGKSGELVAQQLHGRFYEQCYRGNMYSFGVSNTVLSTTSAIVTGLTSTATPVLALYNPSTSLVNLVILQATIVESLIAGTAVSPGGFMWLYSANNTGVSTGSAGINCKTLVSGGTGKAFAISTALTGLTTSLAVLRACPIGGINAAGAGTAVALQQNNTQDNVDGCLIVPPGGVIAIMNQVSTITVNCSVGILWEEVPI